MGSSKVAVVKAKRKSLAKGLIAGLIGGLAATAAKRFVEQVFPPEAEGAAPSRGLALAAPKTQLAEWGFGASMGAGYGALAEFYPPATARVGASFGVAMGTLTEEGALPAIGYLAKPREQTMRSRTSEMTSFIVYGVVTEVVRRVVRKVI